MTFVSNTTIHDVYYGDDGSFVDLNGYLMMADGTRYDITTGHVQTITDRNGNRLSFTYAPNPYLDKQRVLSITDSLGRQVLFAYDLQDSVGKYDRIKYSGFGGIERIIKVRYTHLQDALRHTQSDDSPTTKSLGYLFPNIYEEGFGGANNAFTYNPDDVVSAVELPDGRSYQLYYNVYDELARVVLPTGGAIEYDYTAPNASVISSY